jgi:hypothetical protein
MCELCVIRKGFHCVFWRDADAVLCLPHSWDLLHMILRCNIMCNHSFDRILVSSKDVVGDKNVR